MSGRAGLPEGNGRSGITYLASKTGRDARAAALAALAEQFSLITLGGPVHYPIPRARERG